MPHRLLPLGADDAERGLHGVLVDDDGFHGTVGGAHAAGDIAALKGRTCGAGAGHHEIAVAEDQLAVGAEVDEERELVLVPDEARECARGDIAADIRADVRRQQDLRVRVGRASRDPWPSCRATGRTSGYTAPCARGWHLRRAADGSLSCWTRCRRGRCGTRGSRQTCTSRPSSGRSVSFRIASCRRFVPPAFCCSTMRLMTSAP